MMGFISIFPISLNETTPYISNLYIFDNLRLQYSEVMFHVSCWKTELLAGLDGVTTSPSFLQNIYFHYCKLTFSGSTTQREIILMARIVLFIINGISGTPDPTMEPELQNKTDNKGILFENILSGQIKVPSLQSSAAVCES